MKTAADCDEAVRRIGAKHGPEIERLWREDLERRRARVAPVEEPERAPPAALASALRTLRRERRLTQEELGRLAGHSRTYITRLEGGHIPLANGAFARIVKGLGVEAAEVEARAGVGAEGDMKGVWS